MQYLYFLDKRHRITYGGTAPAESRLHFHSNRCCKQVLFRLFHLPAFMCMCVHVRVRVRDALAASENLSSSCEGLCPFTNCYLFKIGRQP